MPIAKKKVNKSSKKIAKKTTEVKAKSKNKTKNAKKTVKAKSKKPLPIPKGYHTITPYFMVEGAAKAIEFYKKAFGAKIVMRMDKPGDQIAHAELKIGDSKMMISDKCTEMAMPSGASISIHLYVKKVDDVVKQAVAAGAKIIRPVENAFYGDRCGLVQDPFGLYWSVGTHVEDVSVKEMKKRAMACMGKS